MSGSQYVNQWLRPHFWFVVYADPLTCLKESPPVNEVIEFEMEFLNPDSSGAATDHFGDDLRGESVCSQVPYSRLATLALPQHSITLVSVNVS